VGIDKGSRFRLKGIPVNPTRDSSGDFLPQQCRSIDRIAETNLEQLRDSARITSANLLVFLPGTSVEIPSNSLL